MNAIEEAQWSRLIELIAERTGLHFPHERQDDLRRGLIDVTQELGFADLAACVDGLTSATITKAQLQVLASHLTIGETYFFRDKQTLEALSENILPKLIRTRRGREQRLRIWSAACCSGEEPYSLAILLHQLLPDLQDWQVTITATDINARFLHKAAAGIYGEWSFRNAPSGLKARYFTRNADGRYVIVPEIRRMVTFAHLNLVEDAYPSLATDTNAMDLIFCRNVLMYFTPLQISKVIGKLGDALVQDGWLAVSPSEASHALFPQFAQENFPGAILYQKSNATARKEQLWKSSSRDEMTRLVTPVTATPLPWALPVPLAVPQESSPLPPAKTVLAEAPLTAAARAELLYQQGHYSEAVDTLLTSSGRRAPDVQTFSLLARALANQGKLTDALTWCERWIAADKLDTAGHYLRAIILLEQGDPEQARASLQRALYLDHDFVPAHFALGNLARSREKFGEADKHFANALNLLRRYQSDDLLPATDGLTAGRLTETITSIIDTGTAP